jgi:hypothetical protein
MIPQLTRDPILWDGCEGKYDWTAETDWIADKFEVVAHSRTRVYFGTHRRTIGKLTVSEKRKYQK